MHIATFDQLGIAKLCPKQEIIDVIPKSKVFDYLKIEIIHFMIDTSHKFAINTTDIKIKEGVLFVTVCTTFEQLCVVIYITFAMSPKYLKFSVQISFKYLQLYDSKFAIA